VVGCNGLSQSIIASPLKPRPEAVPGKEIYSDLEIGSMQQIVTANPKLFGGLWGDPNSRVVTIYIASNTNAAERVLAGRLIAAVKPPMGLPPSAWRIGFITEGPSLAELELIRSRVLEGEPWHTAVGKNLVGWFVAADRHAVFVLVETVTPEMSAKTVSQYGELVILETSEKGTAL
jgi:hypothetical protein